MRYQKTPVVKATVGQLGLTPAGLSWAAVLAENQIPLLCSDLDEEVINGIMEGVMPGEIPGLADKVTAGINNNHLQFLTNPRRLFKDCGVIFVSTMMPLEADGLPSTRFTETICRQAAYQCANDTVLVIRSLMPAEIFRKLQQQVDGLCAEREEKIRITLCMMPEPRTGDVLQNMTGHTPLIIGCDGEVPAALTAVLEKLPGSSKRNMICTPEEAILIAYGYSGYAALQQSYLEAVGRLCHAAGAESSVVLTGLHKLAKTDSLQQVDNTGAGYGGTALPNDLETLVALGRSYGARQFLTEAAIAERDRHTTATISRLIRKISPKNKTIAVLGLAPVADTDDLRNTPGVDMVASLIHAGANVKLFMPCGLDQAKWRLYKERDAIAFCKTPTEATKQADVVLILGKWKGMQRILTKALPKRMKGQTIYDVVCGLDGAKVRALGLTYSN